MQAAQQYDFFNEENASKWRGLLVPSLEKIFSCGLDPVGLPRPQNLDALERIRDDFGSQKGPSLLQKEFTLPEFLLVKLVLAGSANSTFSLL